MTSIISSAGEHCRMIKGERLGNSSLLLNRRAVIFFLFPPSKF
jgi:hypothetical protein